eukprot:XP_014070191.1 PREDICTED: arginine vasopressin-induced protein 1 isoform X5 [Salmo salar]
MQRQPLRLSPPQWQGPPHCGVSLSGGVGRLAQGTSLAGVTPPKVNLRQLQRLFTAAGDQDAEQRAELVWGHGDEAELAQALIGLRARGRRRELRVEGRGTLGSRWLQAFNHLRIGKSSESSQQSKEQSSDSKTEARAKHSCPDTQPLTPKGPRGATGVREDLTEGQGPAGASERPARPGALLKKGGESDPERYLHRILH